MEAIQLEILENGPVQANIRIYEDFLNYKTGIFKNSIIPFNNIG